MQVGEHVEPPIRKTYKDSFMEDVRNLGQTRERKMPHRFREDAYQVAESLISDIDDPKSVNEALNGKHAKLWKITLGNFLNHQKRRTSSVPNGFSR